MRAPAEASCARGASLGGCHCSSPPPPPPPPSCSPDAQDRTYESRAALLAPEQGELTPEAFVAEVNSDAVYEQTIGTLQLDISVARLRDRIDVSNTGVVIEILARGPSPRAAQTLARVFSSEARDPRVTDHGSVLTVHRQALTPDGPITDNTARNTAAAAAGSLVLGMGLALIIAQREPSARHRLDVARLTGWPVLAEIPFAASGNDVPPDTFAALQETLAGLRQTRSFRTLLVTGVDDGDGASTVTVHLAQAAARAGLDTTLLDADLVDPAVHTALGIENGPACVAAWSRHQRPPAGSTRRRSRSPCCRCNAWSCPLAPDASAPAARPQRRRRPARYGPRRPPARPPPGGAAPATARRQQPRRHQQPAPVRAGHAVPRAALRSGPGRRQQPQRRRRPDPARCHRPGPPALAGHRDRRHTHPHCTNLGPAHLDHHSAGLAHVGPHRFPAAAAPAGLNPAPSPPPTSNPPTPNTPTPSTGVSLRRPLPSPARSRPSTPPPRSSAGLVRPHPHRQRPGRRSPVQQRPVQQPPVQKPPRNPHRRRLGPAYGSGPINSRPISKRRISLVPAPISSNLASRR